MHRHLLMFASLFLFLWAAISIGCSSKSAEERSDSSAPSNKSASFGPKEVTLLPGTAVTVRLSGAVGSKLSAKGDHFRAIVAQPMKVNGKVVVPAGAEALGRVVEAMPQGRFKGAAQLRLVLETVTLDKDSYDVQTGSVTATRRERETHRDLHRRRRRRRCLDRRTCRRWQGRPHRRGTRCRCGDRGSGLYRGERDCPARRLRAQLHTYRTRQHQDVAKSRASTSRPTGRLFHRFVAHDVSH